MLMLYREVGGTGYDLAINKLSDNDKEFYEKLMAQVNSIKEDVAA